MKIAENIKQFVKETYSEIAEQLNPASCCGSGCCADEVCNPDTDCCGPDCCGTDCCN